MSINAVKGVEIGDGFGAARLRGEDNADAMSPRQRGGKPVFAVEPCGRHRGRHLAPGSRWWCGSHSSRHRRS